MKKGPMSVAQRGRCYNAEGCLEGLSVLPFLIIILNSSFKKYFKRCVSIYVCVYIYIYTYMLLLPNRFSRV